MINVVHTSRVAFAKKVVLFVAIVASLALHETGILTLGLFSALVALFGFVSVDRFFSLDAKGFSLLGCVFY